MDKFRIFISIEKILPITSTKESQVVVEGYNLEYTTKQAMYKVLDHFNS